MLETRYPTLEEFVALDDQLALEGVAAPDRPDKAIWHWRQKTGAFPGPFGQAEAWFRQKFAELHPSVDFGGQPFMYLCVSARGVSYVYWPPVIFGEFGVQPIKFARISDFEVGRIFKASPNCYWELMYQSADAMDLFGARMNFHTSNGEAGALVSVGMAQLEASARQLVAGKADPSLPQGAAMAAELVLKGVLASKGVPEAERFALGHKLEKIAEKVAQLLPTTNDQELISVAGSMPKYSQVRYAPPQQTIIDAQNFYRRSLFLCAEAMRRTNHDNVYHQMIADVQVPPRVW